MAQTADTSQASLKYIKETNWGELPSTGQMKALRYTGEGLILEKGTTISEEINETGQIADLIQITSSTAGDIDAEISYNEYDPFIEAALRSATTFGTTINRRVTASITANDTVAFTSNAPAQTFKVGEVVKLTGWSGTANNGVKVITAIGNTYIEVAPNTLMVEATAAGKAVTSIGLIENGNTLSSFSIEKEFGDVNNFFLFTGMMVDTMGMNIEADAKITTKFGFMGRDAEAKSTSSKNGQLIQSQSFDVMDASTRNMIVVGDGGVLAYVKSISVDTNNGLRTKPVIAQLEPSGISKSRLNVTGSVMLYFTDYVIFTKFKENERMSVTFTIGDGTNNYGFTLLGVKFTDVKIVSGGPDQDVMVEASYQAVRHPTENATIRITKF